MKKISLFLVVILCLSVFAGCGQSKTPPAEIPSQKEVPAAVPSQPETFVPVPSEPETKEPETTEPETTKTAPVIPQDQYVGDILITVDAEEADISYNDVKWLGVDMGKVLDSLPNLKRIYMIGCGLTNAEYAALQDSHPNVRIIWEINLNYWTLRTDAVGFTTFNSAGQSWWMTNEDAYYLRYCTDMVALDLGHNRVTDLSFLQYMPNLKVLLLVDNLERIDESGRMVHISDFSWLKYCPKLRYLEIFVSDAKDLSFLKYCREIEDLNISYTLVDSIEYLKDLPNLQRLWMEGTYVSYEDFQTLTEIYPNATLVYYGTGSIDQGWRDGPHYWAMRNMVLNNVIDPVYAD